MKELYRIQEEYDILMDEVLRTFARKLWDDFEKELGVKNAKI